MFDLGKAVERAKAVYEKAQHHPVGVSVLSDAWGMKSDDGRVWRSAAALIQYRLLTDSGTGKTRKFQITDTAKRIILDTAPESERRKRALESAALAPMIHKELWDKYRTARGLAESVIKTYLTIDREEAGEAPYSPSAAEEVLNTYRASLAYAGISDSDGVTTADETKGDSAERSDNLDELIRPKVGDYVKWTSGGVDQFDSRKVEWVSEEGSHLRVFGSPTGIPTIEVEIVDPPAPHQATHTLAIDGSSQESASPAEITVYQVGGRLQITANVDIQGIEKLEKMLAKYKEILKMLS